jgi:type I restriction enzyme S subunit
MTVDEPRLGAHFTSRRERGSAGLPTLSVTLDRGLVLRDTLERRTETSLSPEEHLRVREGDIAYNMMRMWQGASGLAEMDALVSPAYVVLAPKPSVDPRFAAYLFKLPEMVHRFWAYSYGLTDDRLRLYFNDFRRIPWTLPPLSEQKKIADILSTWDKAIKMTEKLLVNAEAQKRALMQQLLTGKRRVKGFEGREWKSIAIGRVWKVTTGQPAPNNSYDFCSDGIPFLRVSSLAPLLEGASETSFEKVSSATVDQYRLKLFPAGTVVFAKSGMSAKLGRVYRLAGDAYLVSHLAALLPNRSKGDERFLFYYLQMFPPSDLIQGDGFPSIKTSLIAERHIGLPSLPEQTAIADCLDALEQTTTNYRVQLNSLILEKHALMQQLLTGKKRATV